MVAPKNISPRNFNNSTPGPTYKIAQSGSDPRMVGQDSIARIIDQPQIGEFVRELVTWKTPHLGYVQMYINPDQISIQAGKDISSTRTKAGFVIQYAGEKLTKIVINGTTGSAGMEGINILEQVYRSEQFAFNPISEALDRSVTSANMLAMFKSTFNVGSTGVALIDNYVSQSAAEAVLDIFEQPFPTLASLAASVEMFFQGVNYRGYFENFRVEESGQSAGLFTYSLEFTAFAKQGTRRNFMPWHKQPSSAADSNGPNAMSFYMYPNETAASNINQGAQQSPESSFRQAVGDAGALRKTRDVNSALGVGGRNLTELDLRDTEV